VLQNPTAWSSANFTRFKNMIRALARITISRGKGRGGALGIIRLRPAPDSRDKLRATLRDALDPGTLDGIIAMHLIENDPVLSKPITADPPISDSGSGDWFVLIDGTDVNAVGALIAKRFTGIVAPSELISTGTYTLMWDLAKSDIPL
jgi:hypothetical protein